MRIAFITAGAAGMYCGSCMHDNTLASALIKRGHDALLIPTYTPIRTDEEDVTHKQVFFGGVNVYLQQKSWLFRQTPWLFDKLLNFRGLLRWVSRFAVRTRTENLGGLTISMLQGRDGKQRKEVKKLVQFLETEVKPELVLLTNVLLSGIVPTLRERLNVPVIGILQGDDIFLEGLREPDRKQAQELIRKNGSHLHSYLCTSRYYADFMSNYLQIPREKMHVIHPGLNLKGHSNEPPFREQPPYTIGYFARICKDKGIHNLVDAFICLKKMPDCPPVKLKVSGWLGENHRPFFEEQIAKLKAANLLDDFEHVDSPSHADKVRFLHGIDVLSVPTSYHEPKGLYLLEAWANGVPVVQPRHGSFPELIEATEGGLLVESDNPQSLAEGLKRMLLDTELRRSCARRGKEAVQRHFTAEAEAQRVEAFCQRVRSGD
jgi:glycosyltransferase involved in cell wall biosynthesis